jgi:amidophosphoribosyltransferase
MTGAKKPFQPINDILKEKCAVFGVYGHDGEAARVTYYGLWALQHRGQESSGIASADTKQLHRHAANGLVANVYRNEDLDKLPGNIAIGHNRYATSGDARELYNQPIMNSSKSFAFAHNGNLPDITKLSGFLEKHGVATTHLNDSHMMAEAIDHYIVMGKSLEQAIKAAYPLFEGVFSAVAMDKNKLVAFRDICGIRPLSIATLGDGYVVASETCAFDTIGAKFLRDIQPGEMIVIDKNGLTSHQVVQGRQKLDIFEFVYFARPDSVLMGQRVNSVRERFGAQIAKEFSVEADVVIPVPDSSIPAAIGYARATGIPFNMGLIKNRYIHRTFIQPTAEMRRRDVKMKLNPVIEAIAGKRVVLVDDSIVRGTTMRQVVQMIREAGAKELHVLISCPPVKYPDFYGINTPDQADLISARLSIEETREYLGADSLHFLSHAGMVRATQLPETVFSMSCFTGVYPIPIGKAAKTITHTPAHPRSTHTSPNSHRDKSKQKTAEPVKALA